jgi:hypothetical protein
MRQSSFEWRQYELDQVDRVQSALTDSNSR